MGKDQSRQKFKFQLFCTLSSKKALDEEREREKDQAQKEQWTNKKDS